MVPDTPASFNPLAQLDVMMMQQDAAGVWGVPRILVFLLFSYPP